MPKTNKTEYERRILTVQGWIIEGHASCLIVQQILGKEWCTSVRQAERMIAEGRKRWYQHESESLEERRKLKIAQLEHRIRTMKPEFRGTPDGIRAATAVDKEIIKLEGYTPKAKEKEIDDHVKELVIKVVRGKGNNIQHT